MTETKWTKIKDPNAILDYLWNWSTYLGDDTITAAVFTVYDDADGSDETPVVLDDFSFSDTTATAWLSGGQLGATTKPVVTCHIVTAGGREDDRSLYLTIKEL